MDECIDVLGKAKMFSTLDANSDYCQIEMDDKCNKETAFDTHHELFKYTRMSFELRNAPATIQHAMDVILVSMKWQQAIVLSMISSTF